ncbi:MAG: c-type cytochrome [Myxococcales bacterium FL481]|nr:MAG: c-type cytochrome [Myxococcales bacterium FL481]
MTATPLLGNNLTSWMPESASTLAPRVDAAYSLMLAFTSLVFLVLVGSAIFFVIKYRYRGLPQVTSAGSGSLLLHLSWALIPGIMLVLMFQRGLENYADATVAPGNAIDVQVNVDEDGLHYDIVPSSVKADELVVPLNQPVKLTIHGGDAAKTFAIPAFRTSASTNETGVATLWFEATQAGEFDLWCTAGCSDDLIVSQVSALGDDEYGTWLDNNAPGSDLPLPEYGKMVFAEQGCVACHSDTGDQAGKACPPLGGQFGTQRTFVDGSNATMDEAYVKESIFKPNAKLVKGFQPVMPAFEGRLRERQIDGLVAYIKSLK